MACNCHRPDRNCEKCRSIVNYSKFGCIRSVETVNMTDDELEVWIKNRREKDKTVTL
jgi:hypothetical protein